MSTTPTLPFASPPPNPAGSGGKLSPVLITVISIAAVLLLAVVAMVFLLLGQQLGAGTASDVESASPTPATSESSSPSPSASEEGEQPVDTSTRFTSFSAPTTVFCDPNAEAKPKIQVSWSSANAETAWFAPDNGDASDGTGYRIPLSGIQDDITDNDHEFPCNHRGEQDYTLTLVGPNGEKVHQHWTVVDPAFGN